MTETLLRESLSFVIHYISDSDRISPGYGLDDATFVTVSTQTVRLVDFILQNDGVRA